MGLWQSTHSEVWVFTLDRSWQFAQSFSCFMCARDTLPGISSVSTFAANAPENDIMEMAISQPVAFVFRHPSARITLSLIHVDRNHVDDACNQQHEKQRNVQHVPV